MPSFVPAYLHRTGELERRAAEAYAHLSSCDLCAWNCRVDRRERAAGVCHTGLRARVSSWGAHMGEEDPLRGWRGSGTIFFTRCNLRCRFCQNHDISQTDAGREVEPAELAEMMLALQRRGCHNINLVSPSHVVAQVIGAVSIAAGAGLCLPLVYNTGGYDSPAALALLDGIVDIYMPDMKYGDEAAARRYSGIPRYPAVNQAAVREMHRQVGDLQTDGQGLATRGLLVRHLVLPGGIAGTAGIAGFLAREISPDTYLNLMDQYHPAYQAHRYPELSRRITAAEYAAAVRAAREAGLRRTTRGR